MVIETKVKTSPKPDSLMLALLDARTKAVYLSHVCGLEAEAIECHEAITRLIERIDERASNEKQSKPALTLFDLPVVPVPAQRPG
ncbi:MAG: hypothetical protein HY665_08055 [Chloroflexi bacterium]|nr:hypothetical protein [Chloroflexota bacterium]